VRKLVEQALAATLPEVLTRGGRLNSITLTMLRSAMESWLLARSNAIGGGFAASVTIDEMLLT